MSQVGQIEYRAVIKFLVKKGLLPKLSNEVWMTCTVEVVLPIV
jgi:hypothetical protein